MRPSTLVGLLIAWLCAGTLAVEAQPSRVYRVGVIFQGGVYAPAVDGLRDGLKEFGLEQGKDFILHVRDVRSDARSLEDMTDAMVNSQLPMVVEAMRAQKRIPVPRAPRP